MCSTTSAVTGSVLTSPPRAGREVHGQHVVGGGARRREGFEGVLDPIPGRLLEIQIAIDARGRALAAKRLEPLVDGPPVAQKSA